MNQNDKSVLFQSPSGDSLFSDEAVVEHALAGFQVSIP